MTPEERDNFTHALYRVAWAFEDATGSFEGLMINPRVENALHEAIHLVTMNIAFLPCGNGDMSDAITALFEGMKRPQQQRFEARAVTAEVLILRSMDAFKPDGEPRFIESLGRFQANPLLRVQVARRLREKKKAEEDAALTIKSVLQWSESLNYFTC